MRFELFTVEKHQDFTVVPTSYGELPYNGLFDGDSPYTPPEMLELHKTWHGLRYNFVLMYEAARQLTAAGHQVYGGTLSGDVLGEMVTTITYDGIFIENAVFNSDVVFIRNCDTGQYCILDMQDYPTMSQYLSASDNCIAVYMTMHEQRWIKERAARPEKFKPFAYFPMYEEAAYRDVFAARIRARRATDTRLFFAGTLGNNAIDNYVYYYTNPDGEHRPWREVAIYMKELAPQDVVVLDRHEKLERRAWWDRAAQHRWNLFLAGGPWCNREHELWIRGCATIGFTYDRHPLMVPIVPNHHYVAVTAPEGTDEQGRPRNPKVAAQAILDRFYEVRDDEHLAATIAGHAAHRMDSDASTPRLVQRVLTECRFL